MAVQLNYNVIAATAADAQAQATAIATAFFGSMVGVTLALGAEQVQPSGYNVDGTPKGWVVPVTATK